MTYLKLAISGIVLSSVMGCAAAPSKPATGPGPGRPRATATAPAVKAQSFAGSYAAATRYAVEPTLSELGQ